MGKSLYEWMLSDEFGEPETPKKGQEPKQFARGNMNVYEIKFNQTVKQDDPAAKPQSRNVNWRVAAGSIAQAILHVKREVAGLNEIYEIKRNGTVEVAR